MYKSHVKTADIVFYIKSLQIAKLICREVIDLSVRKSLCLLLV